MNTENIVLLLLTTFEIGLCNLNGILEDVGTQLRRFRYSIRGPYIQSSLFDKDVEEYDFIVVGAGSAGAVLASRLSENPNWKILLIEEGTLESPLGQIPRLGSVMVTTQYGWTYSTVHQNNSCFGRFNNECFVRTGRGLGGGSAINGIVYSRGHRDDFNNWASKGNPGWSYEEVLPYFKKSENVNLKNFEQRYHHYGGPLNIEDLDQISNETEAFLKAGEELGYQQVDYNGRSSTGISTVQLISRNGRRLSTSKAYLEPIGYRRNLIIKTNSHALKILIDENKKVQGIIYKRKRRVLKALAKKEVIISCGALNSPQLLMVSGIGPKDHLQSLGIPLIQDLKVGYNLLDHFNFIGINFYYDTFEINNNVKDITDWLFLGTGPLRTGGVDAIAYIKTNPNLSYPDIELALVPIVFSQGAKTIKIFTNFEKYTYDSVWEPYEGKNGFNILVILTRPKSVGRLKIRSNSTFTSPLIDLNYLSEPEDVDTLLKGIRAALAFGKSASFERLGVRLNTLKVAGCEEYTFNSDEYWRCAIPIEHISSYHYQGTCKMGSSNDPGAVVNNELKVYGIEGLRVVDSSVIPTSITGHLEASAVMIAEKAGDIIKRDWQKFK